MPDWGRQDVAPGLWEAAVTYCCPRGIPVTVFLGRVGGRPWTDEDRQAALEWQASDTRRCDGCGHDTNESMAVGNAYAYKATAVRCHACHAIELERARLYKDKADPHYKTRYRVTTREPDGDVEDTSGDGPQAREAVDRAPGQP